MKWDGDALFSVLVGFLIGCLIALTVAACANGSRSYKPRPRKETSKLFVPCHSTWVASPEGKFCNRTCTKRRGKKCKEWKVTVKDMTRKEDWTFMKNGGFGCLDLDQVL